MPSGKRARQARRQVPPPPVRGAGGTRAQRQLSRRTLAIAGAVAALVVIGVVVAVVASGGNGKTQASTLPTSGSVVNGLPGAADVHAKFNGIPQNGLVLGSPSAPVTMVEYIDLQCPFCREFETQVWPGLVATYVRTGKVKVQAQVLAFIGPDSLRGRDAMIAASFQNHAFDFAQLLYDNQQTENTGWLNDAIVAKAAQSIPGVNPRQLVQSASTSRVQAIAARIDAEATAKGVHQTPTLFVGKSGAPGKLVPMASPTDGASVVAAIKAALA